jgi:hypothetical protein
MQPKSVNMPPTIDLVDPEPSPSRGKRAVKILMALIHILIGLLLFSIIVVVLASNNRTFFILYILPLIILTIVLEVCHLRHHRLPPRIMAKLGALARLRGRAFAYQAASAYGLVLSQRWYIGGYRCYGNCGPFTAVRILAWIVWSLGVALYVLALVSSECGFANWVEEPEEDEESKIQLADSDSEDGDLVGRDISRV